MTKNTRHNINLLIVTNFFQELVLWYAIFIPFAYSIGLGLTQVSISIVAVNIGVLIFEIPSGVLADRWSRKWTIVLASVILMSSAIVLGTSSGSTQYIVAAFLWGMYFAARSGTYDAIIFDILKDDNESRLYKKVLARFYVVGTVGLVIGSVSGGLVSEYLSFRHAILLSIIPVLVSMPFILKVKEPKGHQTQQTFGYLQHFKIAFHHLHKNKQILYVTLLLALVTAAIGFIFELNQTYYFAVALPLVLYGVAYSSIQIAVGLGPWLASLKSTKTSIHIAVTILAVAGMIVLFYPSVFAAWLLSVIMVIFFFLATTYGHYVQSQVPSKVRASATSMISSFGRAVFTLFIILFALVNSDKNSTKGFWILSFMIVGIIVLSLLTSTKMGEFDREQTTKLK